MTVLVYAGRRPGPDLRDRCLADVTAQVQAAVAAHAPRLVIGSAAAGADLLVLEAAHRAGAPATVMLAGERGRFRASSVADLGEVWGRRFDAAVAAAQSVVELPREPTDADSYAAVTAAIANAAVRLRRPREALTMVAVGRPRAAGADETEALVTRMVAIGATITRIIPESS